MLAVALCGALGASAMAGEEAGSGGVGSGGVGSGGVGSGGVGASLEALEQQYEEAEGSYSDKFAAVKAAYEAFAREHAGTEEGLSALLFLLRNTWWERKAGTMEDSSAKLVDEILAGYADSPQLAKVIEYKYVLGKYQRTTVFEKLLAESPHDAVKAEALMALAIADKTAEPETSKQRFADLRDGFGKVKRRGVIPYAEYAEAHLAPHDKADLAVGKKAPEIVGRDLDGKPMRLSDHLGKVVVLDFWGDW
jgi:hypothetical protein